MEYIKVENGIIIDHCCGAEKPEGAIEVPEGFSGGIGMPLAALKEDLSGVKPISQQVKEGIFLVPEGYKINDADNGVTRMGQNEIDALYPPEIWAVPGQFHGILVHKTFDSNGVMGYFPPEDAVRMEGPRPTAYHKAASDGSWTVDMDAARNVKLTEINAAYDAATSALVATYPQTELLTFDKQEAEARAWTADHAAETPLVDMLAAGRQMDKAELMSRIIAKADAFALATGYLTGQRQRYEDLLDAATSAEEVEVIVPQYVLPEGLSL